MTIVRALVLAGNSVVVVEHEEAMIRAADHVIGSGPEPGHRQSNVVFDVNQMLGDAGSITGAYFSGRRTIKAPARGRP